MKGILFIALAFVAGLSVEVAAQQVKVENVYYSLGNDPKYGKVAVIDSCRKKAHLGLELLLPTEVEIGGIGNYGISPEYAKNLRPVYVYDPTYASQKSSSKKQSASAPQAVNKINKSANKIKGLFKRR